MTGGRAGTVARVKAGLGWRRRRRGGPRRGSRVMLGQPGGDVPGPAGGRLERDGEGIPCCRRLRRPLASEQRCAPQRRPVDRPAPDVARSTTASGPRHIAATRHETHTRFFDSDFASAWPAVENGWDHEISATSVFASAAIARTRAVATPRRRHSFATKIKFT